MPYKILNLTGFVIFSILFLPFFVVVILAHPIWEKWSEDALKM